jgi:hypothetical protein
MTPSSMLEDTVRPFEHSLKGCAITLSQANDSIIEFLGPCFDLAVDDVSAKLAGAFYAAGKPLAAVCHG